MEACRNEVRPTKGIDTNIFLLLVKGKSSRNEVRPTKGIDTCKIRITNIKVASM